MFTQSKKLTRSSDYRKRYFEAKNGIKGKYYFCPYCGKIMWNKKKIQIDHIVAVKYAQRSLLARMIFKNTKDGVNSIKNLTASCARCNKRKGAKGGIWIFLGFYGVFFMPVLRPLFFAAVFYYLITNAPYLIGLIIDNIRAVLTILGI